jgi:hypothetical protein
MATFAYFDESVNVAKHNKRWKFQLKTFSIDAGQTVLGKCKVPIRGKANRRPLRIFFVQCKHSNTTTKRMHGSKLLETFLDKILMRNTYVYTFS